MRLEADVAKTSSDAPAKGNDDGMTEKHASSEGELKEAGRRRCVANVAAWVDPKVAGPVASKEVEREMLRKYLQGLRPVQFRLGSVVDFGGEAVVRYEVNQMRGLLAFKEAGAIEAQAAATRLTEELEGKVREEAGNATS